MKIALYWEDRQFFPAVKDLLAVVFEDYPQIDEYEQWSEETTPKDVPLLCFGKVPEHPPLNFVKTLSQKQILAFGASITELKASIDRLLDPPKFAPMTYELDKPLNTLGDVVVVDIETGGDFEAFRPEEKWLLSVAFNDGKSIIVWTIDYIAEHWRELVQFLTHPKRKLIAHNMKFDFRTLSEQLGCTIHGHLDTMLLQHVINPGTKAGDYGLKGMAQRYLGAPEWEHRVGEFVKGTYKEMPANYPKRLWDKYVNKVHPKAKKVIGIKVGYEAIPPEILYEYNAYDVYWTWHLYEFLARTGYTDERFMRVAQHEFRMSNLFQEIEKNGVAVDMEYVTELSEKFGTEKDQAIADIRRITGDEKFNPNSPVQVKKFYHSVGYKLKSTDEKTIDKQVFPEGSQAAEFTEALMRARKATKLKGTYADGIIYRTVDGLVYPDFLVHGTSTGRLSSRDPNIQNIPRDEEDKLSLRRIFVPRDPETRSLVSVDYSQAELRVMACLSGDEYLISLFQPGMPDFFDSLMPVAFPRHDLASLDKATKKNMRAKLKAVIYGLSYNRKAPAIAAELDMPVREAQSIINNYFKSAPKFYDWRVWVEETALDPTRTLISPFGRYYQAEVVTSGNKVSIVNSAMAFLPQSTASDICVTAAMEVQKWLHEYDGYIVATIHDAILMDVPDEYREIVAKRTQDEMEAAGRLIFSEVPFATDATWGKSWEGI